MSAHSTVKNGQAAPLEPAEVCKIVVAYDDALARHRGVLMCDRVMEVFGDELDFEFDWLKFEHLSEPDHALRAAEVALKADLLVFCFDCGPLPPELVRWLETLATSGATSEGAIALLFTRPVGPGGAGPVAMVFERAARMLGMDFLPPIASTANGASAHAAARGFAPLDDAPESFHWGLND